MTGQRQCAVDELTATACFFVVCFFVVWKLARHANTELSDHKYFLNFGIRTVDLLLCTVV